jgi:hypothetical protein
MKKFALLALAASTAALATPSMAQTVTGTINISGSVANKCTVVNGSTTSATFGTTINMGELAGNDGTLLPTATLEGTFVTQTAGANIARVVCTTLNPTISVDADPLVNSTSNPTGYVNTVHFQADVAVTKVGSSQTYSNDSNAAAGSATPLGAALAATGNNVAITTSNWRTISNSGQQMVAGSYNNGKIVVTIAPGA